MVVLVVNVFIIIILINGIGGMVWVVKKIVYKVGIIKIKCLVGLFYLRSLMIFIKVDLGEAVWVILVIGYELLVIRYLWKLSFCLVNLKVWD